MAHHKPVGKQRWNSAQKYFAASLGLNQAEHVNIIRMVRRAKRRYMPYIRPVTEHLNADSKILEMGCGPTCVAQFITEGKHTYMDPLLDDYRRAWPGSLPKGNFITGMAERSQLSDAYFDRILCIRTISHTQNPELVMHEVERLLKTDGIFIMSVDLWSLMFARLHCLTAKFFPQWVLNNRLYCYTRRGIEHTLLRHFDIQSARRIPIRSWFTLKEEWLYICTRKSAK